jgi:hypothetical protein
VHRMLEEWPGEAVTGTGTGMLVRLGHASEQAAAKRKKKQTRRRK